MRHARHGTGPTGYAAIDGVHSLNPMQLTAAWLRHILAASLLLCLAASPAAPVLAQDTSAPAAIVNALHDKLIEVMKNARELGFQGRFKALEPVVSQNFDTPLIAKVILSRYWDELTDTQKAEFIELFRRLSVATYASRFNSYDSESFVSLTSEELNKGRLLLKTEMRSPGKKPVELDYLMHEQDGKWLIISVIANGVNDLSLKRAEYAAVIKDKGYPALVGEIEGKIQDMEKGKDAADSL